MFNKKIYISNNFYCILLLLSKNFPQEITYFITSVILKSWYLWLYVYVCLYTILRIDEWSMTKYNSSYLTVIITNKICESACLPVNSWDTNRSLTNEVVERPQDATERSGSVYVTIARTRDTRNRYFAYNREQFWLESRTSDVGQGIGHLGTGRTLSQKSRSHRSVSPIVCSHRAFAQENLAIRHYCSDNNVDSSSSLAYAYLFVNRKIRKIS